MTKNPWEEDYGATDAKLGADPWNEDYGNDFEPVEKSSVLRRAGDYGISALKGAIAVPEAAVGLADIVTGGGAGKAAESLGFRPKEAKAILDTYLSPEQQAANKEVSDAEGFLPTLGAAVKNPSVIANTVVESIPSMLGGGVLARGVTKLAPKVAPFVAGAIGEGAVGAGSAAEHVRQQTDNGLLSADQIAPVVASGIGTAAFGAAGGRIAQKLGISDVDTMLAQGGRGATQKGVVRRIVEGGISEGVFEELPQSAQEQIWQNAALDKPLLDGVPEAGALGLLAGGVMGGVASGAFPGREDSKASTQAQPPAATEQPITQPLGLPSRPNETLISFPDGSVGTRAQAEQYINSLPEESRVQARANLYGYTPEAAEKIQSEVNKNPTLLLPNGRNETLIGFPDGSIGTEQQALEYINSLPESERVAARASLLGYRPQPQKPAGPLARAAEIAAAVAPAQPSEVIANDNLQNIASGLATGTGEPGPAIGTGSAGNAVLGEPAVPVNPAEAAQPGGISDMGVRNGGVGDGALTQSTTDAPVIDNKPQSQPPQGGEDMREELGDGAGTWTQKLEARISDRQYKLMQDETIAPEMRKYSGIDVDARRADIERLQGLRDRAREMDAADSGEEMQRALLKSARQELDVSDLTDNEKKVAVQKASETGNAVNASSTIMDAVDRNYESPVAYIGSKNSGEAISVKREGNTLRLLHNGEPLIDYETENEVTLPVNATIREIRDAVKNSGQFPKRIITFDKSYQPQALSQAQTKNAVLSSNDAFAASPEGEQATDRVAEPPRAKLPVAAAEEEQPAQQEQTTGASQEQMDSAPDSASVKLTTSAAANNANAASAVSGNPTEKIADFGEKIGGAKKDLWASYKDKLDKAIGEDVKAVPLSQSWPEPDYQALLDNGTNEWAVAFAHAARDEVPTKPQKGWKVKSWAEKVEFLRDTAYKLLNGELDVQRARSLMGESVSTLRDVAGRMELYQRVGHSQSLKGMRISSGSYSLLNGVEYKPAKTIWTVEKDAKATAFSNWPKQFAMGDTREAAIDAFVEKFEALTIQEPAKKEVSFDIYSKRGQNGYWIGKKVGRNYIDLEKFDGLKEARAYRIEHHDELVAKLEKSKEIPSVRRDTNNPRVGEDMRGGQDVTPQFFGETFGFKGVEFGNWVEQKKRQQDLNDAFDALMDMAAILNIPPKAISLNGGLGLAFGARGSGGIDPANAHYEPDYMVINLTKKAGAGSLGHEWWHALDNYFSRMRKQGGGFMTDALDVSLSSRGSNYEHRGEVRKEMVDAFGEVMKAIRSTALKARSSKVDAKRSKEYWTTNIEMSARAFESYLISKLQDQNASNDYLANIVDGETWNAASALGFELEDSYPYPTAGELPMIRAGFDHFFDTIQHKETDKGIALFSRTGNQPQTDTPEFKRWFGDSKVVDAEGKPLVVYHGTDGDFDVFEPSKSAFFGKGIYFTAEKEAAEEYASDRGGDSERVIAGYMSLQNPYVFDAPPAFDEASNVTLAKELFKGRELASLLKKLRSPDWYNPGDEFRDALVGMGHDGLIVNMPGEPTEYIAFHPEQIKSATGNRGTFDPSNPDISYSRSTGSGMSRAAAENILAPIQAKHKGLPRAVIVQTQNEIPELRQEIDAALQEFRRDGTEASYSKLRNLSKQDVEGAFVNGKLYLVAGNIKDEARLRQVYAHEGIGHLAMEAMLEEVKPGLFTKLLNQVKTLDSGGNKYIRKLAKEVDKRQPGLDRDARAKEIIAMIAERGDQDADMSPVVRSVWQRIVDGIKAFAKLVFNVDLNDQDVRDIVAMAGRHARGEDVVSLYAGGESVMFQRVFHGSPYKFDKFSLDHMGKGEGVQAYGWGLYFAGSKEVADYYRKSLTDTASVKISGAFDPSFFDDFDVPVSDIKQTISEMFQIEANRPGYLKELSDDSSYMGRLAAGILKGKITRNTGQLYEVNIPEDDTLLLWDKPLSEQPENVRRALGDIAMPDQRMDGKEIYSYVKELMADQSGEAGTSPSFYNGFAEAASKYLHSLGINGIKYLDGTSRTSGEGSYNYVIFDDATAEIINTQFSRANRKPSKDAGDSYVTAAMEFLARDPELFQRPSSEVKDIYGIAKELDPGYRVERIGPSMTKDKGADRAWEVFVPGSNVRSGVIMTTADEVWIDVSRLQSGVDSGSAIYDMAATYAHNNGKVLIGDPLGLSRMAFFRRNESMLSSALKYGTTRHLRPSERSFAESVRPLDWKEGDDVHNIKELIYTSWQSAVDNIPELKDVIFNPVSQQFEKVSGEPFTDDDFNALLSDYYGAAVEQSKSGNASGSMRVPGHSNQGGDVSPSSGGRGRINPYRAGSATAKRAALFNTFLRSAGGEGRRQVLGELVDQLSRNGLAPQLKGILYSRDSAGDQTETHRTMFSRSSIIGDSGRYTPEQKAAIERTGGLRTKPSMKEWLQSTWQDAGKKAAQGIVDQFRPVRDIDDHAYTLLRLSKGATGAFEALMHYGKLSIKDGATDADTSGGVLERVFFPLGNESTDFLRWVAGNRAERLMKEGKENLFSKEDVAAFKSLAEGRTEFDYTLSSGKVTRDRKVIYNDTLLKFNGFNKNILDIAEQSGLIDPESRKYWEHEFYVPFYRMADEVDGGVRGMNIKSGVVRQEAFKKLKGGEQQLNDLLANTLMNWAHLIDASAKNRAAKATLESAEKMGAARTALTGEKKTVWFMDKGNKVEYKVEDPYLMTAISSLEYAGMRSPAMNALSATKHWLTIGVTASPFFKVRNLIRDSMQAIATSDLSYNPLGNVKQGFALTNKKTPSQMYVSALAGGGLIRFGTMLEGNEASRVRQLIKQGAKDEHILDNESKVRAVYDKYIEPAIAAYNELGNRGEEVNRMALYAQLTAKGMDHATANLMARDLMDFSMQGAWTSVRFLTQVVPFMNARLQGMYKLGRAAKADKARFATVLGAVSLASLALLAAYGDDDDWKKREDWDRDNYWWFKIGGQAFRIPKPFEIGAIATLAERGAELMFSDEMTGKRFADVTTDLVMNQLSMNPVPQLVKPIVDLYANKDSFTGRPIESMGMERLSPSYRFRQSTSMVARGISSAGNAATGENFLSPVQVDHLVRAYFSWLGSFAVGGADMLVRSVSDEPTKPALDYWKFASGGMVSELDGAQSRYMTNMYDQAKELEQAYGTWRNLLKTGKTQEAAEYRAEHSEDLVRYRQVETVKRAVARMNERIKMIERSNMDSDEKRSRINNIKAMQEAVAKRIVA